MGLEIVPTTMEETKKRLQQEKERNSGRERDSLEEHAFNIGKRKTAIT